MKAPLISIVIPVYKAEDCIQPLYKRLLKAIDPLSNNWEMILIEDASGDRSWQEIERLSLTDKRIKGLKLSRNFGQHAALTAGLDRALGDWIVLMDCDLQDQPEEIPKLYLKACDGWDIVKARRSLRQDSWLRRQASYTFYRLLSYLTETQQDPTISNFGIYSRPVIHAVTSLRESLRYFPAMIQWVGFKAAAIDVEHAPPGTRASSYSLRKLLRLAFDVMISFSEKPLKLAMKLGFIIAGISFVWALILILRALFLGRVVAGWTSLIVSTWFLSGLIISITGIVGIYVGRTYSEVKQRPIYVIEKETGHY
jgi:dolichol-phosphate mannosyltransferase